MLISATGHEGQSDMVCRLKYMFLLSGGNQIWMRHYMKILENENMLSVFSGWKEGKGRHKLCIISFSKDMSEDLLTYTWGTMQIVNEHVLFIFFCP